MGLPGQPALVVGQASSRSEVNVLVSTFLPKNQRTVNAMAVSNTSFDQLFSRFAFTAMDRQLHLAAVHGEHDWEADLEKGEIRFASQFAYQVQVLGSESDLSDTWLWAWANETSDLPETVLHSARRLLEKGNEMDIEELTSPELDLADIGGHELAMVALGLLDGVAYYRGPYDDGAVFFLLTGPPLPPDTRPSHERASSALLRVIETYEVSDVRLGLRHLAPQVGAELIERGELHWQLVAPDGRRLDLTFDDNGRLSGISTVSS
jgi:hypothetical protein